jgi:hypothetical protein
MTYQTRKVYTFVPELSAGHHATDLITTLNVPVLSAYHQMRKANFMTVWGLETIIYRCALNIFVSTVSLCR